MNRPLYTTNLGQCFVSFFKECPHPDDKQRKELGKRLALEPLQVKFWFQNKRTQMKVSLSFLFLGGGFNSHFS